MIGAASILSYATLQVEFGGSGLLRFDQTIEGVAEQRMKGIIGVISKPSYYPARSVALRLNTELAAAIYPADFDIFFHLERQIRRKRRGSAPFMISVPSLSLSHSRTGCATRLSFALS